MLGGCQSSHFKVGHLLTVRTNRKNDVFLIEVGGTDQGKTVIVYVTILNHKTEVSSLMLIVTFSNTRLK